MWKQYRWKIALLKSMYRLMHIYTNCASGTDISIGSSGPGGVWRATSLFLSEGCRLLWSGSWLWFPDTAPNPVSQPLLSSMVERGWTAEQTSLCFYTLVKAATANTHQHSSTWRQLTPFSLPQAEQLALGKTSFVYMCVCMIGRLSSKVINSNRLSMVLLNVL